ARPRDEHDGLGGGGRAQRARLRCRPQTENRFVERGDELRAVAVQQRLNKSAPHHVRIGIAGQTVKELRATARRLTEQDGAADSRRPEPFVPGEQGGQRLPQLLRLERAVLKERELPPVDRLTELWIVIGVAKLR